MTAIRTESLGKRYTLGLNHVRSLRDLVGSLTSRVFRRRDTLTHRALASENLPVTDSLGRFWALRDVSIEVPSGEVVGVIGRNGDGKSTLLKLLARITTPTKGRIELRGRVGSLLEVGTGFHPELTGRENIFLGGAILGMTKVEIRKTFDQIVAFAEIDEFLDTPVKRYSSGMYVRLAFAVAAHLRPEILLVDEVLAVGDAQFQRKCLGKMRDVSSHGRTILFVSHNMDAIKRLCRRVIWLEHGMVRYQGPADEAVARYLLADVSENGRAQFDSPLRLANGMPVMIHSLEVADAVGRTRSPFSAGRPIRVRIEWELTRRLYKPRIGFVLYTADASEVFTALDANSWEKAWLDAGRYESCCVIPKHMLNEGTYVLCCSGDAPGKHDFRSGLTAGLLQFEIEDDMTLPNKYYGQEGFRDARWPGAVLPNLPWVQSRVWK